MSDSSEICPFCHSDIPDGASVCQGCGAQSGYTVMKGRVVSSKGYLLFLTIFFGLWVVIGFGLMPVENGGPFFGAVGLLIAFKPFVGLCRGKRWFR